MFDRLKLQKIARNKHSGLLTFVNVCDKEESFKTMSTLPVSMIKWIIIPPVKYTSDCLWNVFQASIMFVGEAKETVIEWVSTRDSTHVGTGLTPKHETIPQLQTL